MSPPRKANRTLDNQISFIDREKRFEVSDLSGFDAIVRRVSGDEESVFFAELVDFSRTGVKFNLPFCGRFDEQLDVRFEFKNSELYYQGNGRVRHLRSVGENRWQVGCSIDPPLPDEVIAHLASNTNQERRRSSRIDVREVGQVQRQGSIEGCDATLLNISEGGFCLLVDREHEISERIDFVIKNKNGEDEKIAARIRWQNSSDEGFRLGCGFADSESYHKLVECLTSGHGTATESLSWIVIAAALLAMIVPPACYFVLGTPTERRVADVIEPEIVGKDGHVDAQPKSIPADEAMDTPDNNATDNTESEEKREPPTQVNAGPSLTGTADQEKHAAAAAQQSTEPETKVPMVVDNPSVVAVEEPQTKPQMAMKTQNVDTPSGRESVDLATRRPQNAESSTAAAATPEFEPVVKTPGETAAPPVALKRDAQKYQTVVKVDRASTSTRRIRTQRPLIVPFETIDK